MEHRYELEHRIVVSGELKWIRIRGKVTFDKDGNPVKGLGAVQDVTELKRAEEALRRLNRAHLAVSRCNEAFRESAARSAKSFPTGNP